MRKYRKKISYCCREIAFCLVGYFLSHLVGMSYLANSARSVVHFVCSSGFYFFAMILSLNVGTLCYLWLTLTHVSVDAAVLWRMTVRGTPNYVIYFDNFLGTGSTGTVYFARHKVLSSCRLSYSQFNNCRSKIIIIIVEIIIIIIVNVVVKIAKAKSMKLNS